MKHLLNCEFVEHRDRTRRLHSTRGLSPLWVVGFALFVELTGAVGLVHAENWTRFRGPNGSGNAGEVTFPATWNEQDYLWKVALPGIGHSSPVGWEGRLFITSADRKTGDVTLHCFAADSGKPLWQREFAGQTYPMHTNNSYASTTPTVDQRHVYMTWASGGKMRCVALTHQGNIVWRAELGDFVEEHGFAASPIVVDGIVCLQVDQGEAAFLAGVDATSGKVRWRAERPAGKASYATPCVLALADDCTAVLTLSTTGGMQAVEVQTGELLWQLADLFPSRCVSSTLVADKRILGVCGGGGSGKLLVGMEQSADPRSPPIEKLTLTKHVPYVPTPLVKGDWLFLWHDQGKVSLADLRPDAPQKARWTKRIGGKFFGSPILAGDKIYSLSADGRAVVIAADEEFKLLGVNDLGEPTSATPAVHQGKMYLRTESSLACLPAE